MLVVFVIGHEFLGIHLLGLVQRLELDILGREGLVREGPLYRIQIMRANRHQRTVPRQVGVQLVLQADEGLVPILGELDAAQDGAGDEGPDLRRLGLDGDDVRLPVLGLDDGVLGGRDAAVEDVEVEGYALEAEHVVAVGGDLDLELGRLLDTIDDGAVVVFRVFVELDAIFEAEVLELLG